MKKGVTLKDIAAKLNMSVSTVSKSLSNDASISEATRERVKKLADEWQYIPNEAARNFKLNKTFTLGLILPDLLDQFYALAINGVEEVAAEHKYNVIVSQSHEDTHKEEQIIDLMIRNRVDGVIVAISKNTHDMTPFRKLENTGIPVIFLARAPIEPQFHFVSSNNRDGAFKAVNFLVKKGHRRIAYLMAPLSMPVSVTRLDGYKQALSTNNIPLDEELVKEIDFTAPSTNRAMKQLMKMTSPPTAIFVYKNYLSLDVISYLKKNDPLKLNTIDLVGFGNLPFIQHLDHKPVASIEENSYVMGIEAAKLVFKSISETGEEEHPKAEYIQVPCKLVIHH